MYTSQMCHLSEELTKLAKRVLLHSIDNDLLLKPNGGWVTHYITPFLQDLYWQFTISPLIHSPPV